MHNHWWQREGLSVVDQELTFEGICPAKLASAAEIPIFLYSRNRVKSNLLRLYRSLEALELDFRIFYAMKSNRFEEILKLLRNTNMCGIDACSPGEVEIALANGFSEPDISYTGTCLSDADLRFIAERPQIHFNCDSLSVIRRLAKYGPRNIGIRINPDIGLSYRDNDMLRYSGNSATKFGIYYDRLREAAEMAKTGRLTVTGLHFHCGCGYLNNALEDLDRILTGLPAVIGMFPDVMHVNIGGGLGVPLTENDRPLDLGAWSSIIRKHFEGTDIAVWIEPGDYIVKDAGILVLQVNTVEQRKNTVFAGVNGGFNIHMEPAFYGLPLHPVPCIMRPGPLRKITIAGNINEALDIFARDILLPPVKEGDYVALLNAGGYGSSMISNHCCRGKFEEIALPAHEA